MAVSIPISSTMLVSTARTSLSSSFSSSNSVFFNTNESRKFLCPLQSSFRINTGRSRKRLSCNCLFGLGVPELVVIAGVAALVFGPKKLPEVGRSIGKTIKSFQQVRSKEYCKSGFVSAALHLSRGFTGRRRLTEYNLVQAAKEFESELKKDPESVSDSPAEVKSISAEEEEKDDVKVSSSKES